MGKKSKVVHINDYRLVDVYSLAVNKAGRIVNGKPTGQKRLQVRHHSCGGWTWADGKFCMACGSKLKK